MTTLGIDPATRTGLAVVDGPNLVYSAAVTLSPFDYPGRVSALQAIWADCPWQQVAIEGQWTGDTTTPEGRAKAQGAQVVMQSAALWRAAAQQVGGVPPQTLLPGTWRARLGIGGRLSRDQLKALALAFCRARGWVVAGEDEADAACIAAALAWSQKKEPTPKKSAHRS
jgi:hypothetical protein